MHSNPDDSAASVELDERRREIALFRYGVIADLVQLERNERGLYALLAKKAEQDYTIPGSLRRRVAAETIRGWLRNYRRGGFDALVPRARADHGTSRSIPPELTDLLCHLKEENPELSIPMLIKKARADHGSIASEEIALPESTVHRLLARRGLMRKKSEEPTCKDRRRFEYDSACELWMSDVMYGLKIRDAGRTRQTYLIAFIDDATRLVPYAAFAFSEGTIAYLAVLEQAVRRRGIPKRLYVDNGAAFRSKQLAIVCAKLGIALIHARPYTPQGKGKMERWFRTARMQLLPLLRPEDLVSLDTMNRALAAWIEGEYHHAPHRGLGDETPADKWARTSEGVRMPGADLGDHFLAESKRRVQKDRTVTLDGVAFEVDAALVGERVTLRFDAARARPQRADTSWPVCTPVFTASHHLRTELLEDLRLLTNYAMDSENRLTMVLVGHPELRRRMSMAALDAFNQRVVVKAHVRGLTRDEMGPYLTHRLRLAGTELPLFEPPTVEAIFQASSGLPRKANGLAHHALFAAAIAKAKTVTTEHVQAALQEVA